MFSFSDSAVKWVTYLNKQYRPLNTRASTFADAQKLCEDVGAMLPEPRNAEENAYVAQSIAPLSSRWFYLGLKMTKTPGVWVWRSDGSQVTWDNWLSGQQLGGPNPEFDKCGAMTENGKWFSVRRHGISPVICERHITRKYNRHHEKKQTNY